MRIFEMKKNKCYINFMMLTSFLFLGFVFLPVTCFASWINTPGVHVYRTGEIVCPLSPSTKVNLASEDYSVGQCNLSVGESNQVPYSGDYSIVLGVADTNGVYNYTITSGRKHIEAGVELNTLNITWPNPVFQVQMGADRIYICYLLKRETGGQMYSFNNTPQSCDAGSGGSDVLPAPLQCVFADGSTLNIPLGEVDRSLVGAVPGTLPGVEKNINITCTGDGEATYTIGFQYTAVNIAGTEMVSTSANGLAVALSLNGGLVNPMDTYTRTYSTGTQTEKLTFEPVRDPSVKISDIPTGAFSASAVVILTLQ
ncbi:hypothetical protein RVW73_000300 [Enterobacter asburiae]|nr:hypothetical protein [Enterobacter asburiae]